MVIRMKYWRREGAKDLKVRCKGACLWEMSTCTDVQMSTVQIHFFRRANCNNLYSSQKFMFLFDVSLKSNI